MSFLKRTAQGFMGLSAISIVPLKLSLGEKEQIGIYFDKPIPGGALKSSNQENELLEGMVEILKQQESIDQPEIIKKISLNNKGYFPLKDVKKHELFVLIDLDNLNKTFLFHYDWSRRKEKNPKDKLKQVKSITYESFRTAKMKLSGNVDKNLSLPPSWMKDWKNLPLCPEQDCKFQKNSESSYTLICKNLRTSPEKNSLIQEISTKDITFPSKWVSYLLN